VINQPLILQCNATIVSNINGTVDIIWTTGNTQVRRVSNITVSNNINSSSVYNDSLIIPSLHISDIGSVYQCEVLINSVSPTTAKTIFMIPIPGIAKYSYFFRSSYRSYVRIHSYWLERLVFERNFEHTFWYYYKFYLLEGRGSTYGEWRV